MAESRRKKINNKTLWILVLIVVGIGAYFGWRVFRNRQEANRALANIQTEAYHRADLNAFIFGTGTVEPSQVAIITWSTSGTIGQVNVFLGDKVEKDDILMTLDPNSLPIDVLQAEIDLINAQNALNQLNDNWTADLANTRLDLLRAEKDLEEKEDKRWLMNYQRCTDERIEELEEELEDVQDLYDFKQSTENLRLVNTAQANLDYCLADFSEREIKEAELKIELAQAKVDQLQNRVAILASGPDPDEITIQETRIAIAKTRLNSPTIKAPFAGIVTALPGQIGDVVQIGTRALQLDYLEDLRLAVQISEIDIPLVKMGQPVELTFDAFFDSTFNGEVTEIAMVGSTTQGVVEYTVTVKMKDADAHIRPGMTATVTILVEEIKDVFVVPNDAIVSINGQDHVYVYRAGVYTPVMLKLGSYSDYYSEVIEADIKEGELIVLNPPSEITGAMPFGGHPGNSGFGRFGN